MLTELIFVKIVDEHIHQLFDNIPQPDPITCSILISSLTTQGIPNEAINIYASW